MIDVIVVGGGAAGLSAALVLGRSRRHTLVVDEGKPRNAPSAEAHSIFTRDGTPPAELLQIAREQLAPYHTAELRDGRVVSARPVDDGFVVQLSDETELAARRLLLAVGVQDELPAIEGLEALWGRGVLHCPYCHGWEVRDAPLAVYASGTTAMELTPLLLQWSDDVLLCTGGDSNLSPEEGESLVRRGVRIIDTPLQRLEGGSTLERIVFADGQVEPRRALFLRPPQSLASDLAQQLGCEQTETGLIRVGADHRTSVPGIFAAGDATTRVQQLVVAAASGAQAAISINWDLVEADGAVRAKAGLSGVR